MMMPRRDIAGAESISDGDTADLLDDEEAGEISISRSACSVCSVLRRKGVVLRFGISGARDGGGG